MVLSHILRMVAKCRNAGVYLLRPFLMRLKLWKRFQFGCRGVLARGIGVLPFIDVGASTRGTGVENNSPAICDRVSCLLLKMSGIAARTFTHCALIRAILAILSVVLMSRALLQHVVASCSFVDSYVTAEDDDTVVARARAR